MPQPAARVGDGHVCPATTGTVPHVGGPIVGPGVGTVCVGGQPIVVVGDGATCVGPPSAIVGGSPTVLALGRPVARLGDPTAHGGTIVSGHPTVLVG